MNKHLKTLGMMAVLLLAVIAVPASGQQIVINSDIAPSLTFTIDEAAVNFPLNVVGQNDMTTENILSVTSNGAYLIKVHDLNTLPATAGRMRSITPPSTLTGVSLTNAFQMSVNGEYVSLSGTDAILKTGTPGVFSAPVKIRQTTTIDDPVLPAGQHYVIAAIITASATP